MNEEQHKWVERATFNIKGIRNARAYLAGLVEKSEGKCRWTGLPLKFDAISAGGGRGQYRDPLAAVLEHREPNSNEAGHDIVCDYINQMKGCLPWHIWEALTRTPEFQRWMNDLRHEHGRTNTIGTALGKNVVACLSGGGA